MRTGGSLVCNLLSVHKDIIILTDIFHFFRHIYKKYEPITNKSNLFSKKYFASSLFWKKVCELRFIDIL